jgi:acetyltransferase
MTETRHPLDPIFKPRSIAVIGASRKKGSIGWEILHNIVEYEFNGKVFPVNPHAEVIHSIKCFPSVRDIPDPVDLAIIVVPKHEVLRVVDECGQKGVRGLVVITAGFKETGPAGLEREQRLVEKVRHYGMRMIGPNCMGIINTDPAVRLNATFAPTRPLPGRIGFTSQSGALGAAILNMAERLGLGFSMFVSMGNKADVSGNDLLQYWEDDPHTDVILMYLESFGNPRRFTQLARRITKKKPIIAVKAGRTAAGARAASSHTGALAGLDVATEALLEQCGVLRALSIEDLFDLAMAFVYCPIPRGNRVAILTNAGGPAIMATDACVNFGLKIAELAPRTRAHLRPRLPEECTVENPVDLIASADAATYRFALDLLLADENVDAAIVIFVPPIMVTPHEIADAIADVIGHHEKPVLGVFMAPEDFFRHMHQRPSRTFPIYQFPESAARALSALVTYRERRDREEGEVRTFEVEREIVARIVATVRHEGRTELNSAEALTVLEAYGLPVCRFGFARTLKDALIAAREIGYPVVLKVLAHRLTHKSEIGGVIVDVRTDEELIRSFQTLMERVERHGLNEALQGVLVQEMIRGGREVILGIVQDPQFGPLIMFGLGGIYVESLADVVFRIWPITDRDAHEMIRSIRGFPILRGTRGEPPVDFAALEEALMRLSQLAGDFPEIAELDVNPFLASPAPGASKAVDARIRLA